MKATMKGRSNYLQRLPPRAQHRGDAEKGEAEIVTARRERERIASECATELSGSALGKGGKRIGILLEDEVRMVVRDALKFPGGATRCEMRIVGKTGLDGPNGIVALCVQEGKVVLREIFRHATRSWELEAVRGRRELGQTSRQAVRTEVKQELGFPVKRIHSLGQICPDSAILSSVLDVFLVEIGKGPRRDEPEDSEAFGRIHHLSAREFARDAAKGKIRDSYTIGAFSLAQMKGLIPAARINPARA
jgi:ADP-ribose pyrophosphatase